MAELRLRGRLGTVRSQAVGCAFRKKKNTLKQGGSFAKCLENLDFELFVLHLALFNDLPNLLPEGEREGRS